MQRFLGCLNYVSDYFKDLRIICEPLYKRLRKNGPAWTEHHTNLVKEIKQRVKHLPCINIPHPNALLIVESDASNLGYGGILKQEYNNQVHIVRYHSGIWLDVQINYSTIKKEVLSIILCISKFQSDLINKKFLLKIDCKAVKYFTKWCKKFSSKTNFCKMASFTFKFWFWDWIYQKRVEFPSWLPYLGVFVG